MRSFSAKIFIIGVNPYVLLPAEEFIEGNVVCPPDACTIILLFKLIQQQHANQA